MKSKDLNIKYVDAISLIVYKRNARVHSEKQIEKIAESIKKYGFNNPILVDGKNGLIAGHGRLLAAQKLGMKTIPVVELAHLSENQKKAYIIADNRIAEMASWDDAILDAELFDISFGGDDFIDTMFEDDEEKSTNEETKINNIDTFAVYDTFWISIRGPLQYQAQVLAIISKLRDEVPHVNIDIGGTEIDEQ